MSDETTKQSSAFRVTIVAVLLAWTACGIYRWRVPPLVEVRATVKVPAATDLGTLCQRPEIKELALQQFAETAANFDTSLVVLGGNLFAQKIQNADSRSVSVSGEQRERSQASDIWQIGYRSNQSVRIIQEVTALLTVLKQRVQSTDDPAQAAGREREFISKVESLEERLLNNELSLELLNEPDGDIVDSQQLIAQEQRVAALERDHLSALASSHQLQEQGQLATEEFADTQQLAAVGRTIEAGPIQDVIRKLDTRFKLSSELMRLNDSAQRLGDIYGEKHPKLAEVQARFDEVLNELGGWEHVINEQHLEQELRTSIETLLSEQAVIDQSLAHRLESAQDRLATMQAKAKQRAERVDVQDTLKKELSDLRESHSPLANIGTTFQIVKPPEIVELPWYMQPVVLYVLATICGLAAGQWIHRARLARSEIGDLETDMPLPAFSTAPIAQLDLAQRRAARQARLKQAYA